MNEFEKTITHYQLLNNPAVISVDTFKNFIDNNSREENKKLYNILTTNLTNHPIEDAKNLANLLGALWHKLGDNT